MERAGPNDWWRVRRLDDGVTWIDEPNLHDFYRCNVWHVRGRDGDMLVDSGMGVVSLRDWVPLVTERPLQAVASHTHFDHIGCHHEFDCRLCHGAEAEMMRTPTRRAILARLAKGEASVNELVEPFDLSQPAISRHLKVLEHAGLVSRGRDAQRRPVRIEAAPLAEAVGWLETYRQFWEQSYARLDGLLSELQNLTPDSKN